MAHNRVLHQWLFILEVQEELMKLRMAPFLARSRSSVCCLTVSPVPGAARSLCKAMSTLVAQECHLWLILAEMRDVDKVCFLDAPISQAGLFGDTVEDFALQFSAVQRQAEAIQKNQSAVGHSSACSSPRVPPPNAETQRPVHLASSDVSSPRIGL